MSRSRPNVSLLDEVLAYTEDHEKEVSWDNAMGDIRIFIREYVPKKYFDMDKANPQQIQILIDVNKGYRNFVIRAPRKGGKTILVAIIVVWICLKFKGFRWFILSGSLEQAKWLYRYCRGMVTSSPVIMDQLLQDPTQILTEFKNGSFIICSPASFKQVNAPTVDGLAMDEYVLIPPEIIVDAWPMIRASPFPMRFILSTATEKVSLDSFLDIMDRAEELGFRPYFWDDSQCPWLNKQDSVIARAVLTEEDYRVRYEGGVPTRRRSIFPLVALNKAFVKFDKLPEDYFEVVKGPIKVGIDWGFTHDTVFLAGWLSLDYHLNIFKTLVTNKTDDEELANIAVEWDDEFNDRFYQRVDEWLADSAGAFQNAMMRKKGFWVTRRVFGSPDKGKEWMIRTTNWFIEKGKITIPDTPEFALLKKQMKAYRRKLDGKPIKGNDHCVDAGLCLATGWDPTESLEEVRRREARRPLRVVQISDMKSIDWTDLKPRDDAWRPDHWRRTKWPWER